MSLLSPRSRTSVILLACGLVACSTSAAGAAPAGPTAAAATASVDLPLLDRRLLDPRITESSGLARSGYDDGTLWTHNDRGHESQLFAVGRDGRTRATVTLDGIAAVDWEALSRYKDRRGRPWLFVADIGDNDRSRSEIVVHTFEEPTATGDVVISRSDVVTYRFQYESGRHDAEALLVHPWTGRLYVVTKSSVGGHVYEASADLVTDDVNVLRPVAHAPRTVTDGVFLFDGRMVLRDYSRAFVSWGPGTASTTVALPWTAQGESLAPLPGVAGVYVGSEGWSSPVYRQALPVPPSEG